MKHIALTGCAGCGKTTRAEALYHEHTSNGLQVVIEDDGGIRNSHPDRRLSAADVLITTRLAPGPLNETTKFTS